MGTERNVSQEIIAVLKSAGNADYAAHSKRFFKTGEGEYGEGDLFLGIRVPEIRKFVVRFADVPEAEIEKSLSSPYHEIRLFGFLSLAYRFKKADAAAQKILFDTYVRNKASVNNWDIVDVTAPNVIGAYLLDRDKKLLYELARSPGLWDKRIAILATFTFIKAGKFKDTLTISEILLLSKEDLIHKAVGWMLREIGKMDLETEEIFLKNHYRTMPRTMLRYAIERFEEAKRQKYLKGEM